MVKQLLLFHEVIWNRISKDHISLCASSSGILWLRDDVEFSSMITWKMFNVTLAHGNGALFNNLVMYQDSVSTLGFVIKLLTIP